jgi:hypothetical protein
LCFRAVSQSPVFVSLFVGHFVVVVIVLLSLSFLLSLLLLLSLSLSFVVCRGRRSRCRCHCRFVVVLSFCKQQSRLYPWLDGHRRGRMRSSTRTTLLPKGQNAQSKRNLNSGSISLSKNNSGRLDVNVVEGTICACVVLCVRMDIYTSSNQRKAQHALLTILWGIAHFCAARSSERGFFEALPGTET